LFPSLGHTTAPDINSPTHVSTGLSQDLRTGLGSPDSSFWVFNTGATAFLKWAEFAEPSLSLLLVVWLKKRERVRTLSSKRSGFFLPLLLYSCVTLGKSLICELQSSTA
jgi:hypothetical protein